MRYVEDPLNPGKYIDMTHFLYVGKRGPIFGYGVEFLQMFGYNTSAFTRQDMWSNALGYAFWTDYGLKVNNNPTQLTDYVVEFLWNR